MPTRQAVFLDVVPEHGQGDLVVRVEPGRPVYVGRGWASYACGRCGAVLCEGVQDEFVASLVFLCSCGSYNRVSEAATGCG